MALQRYLFLRSFHDDVNCEQVKNLHTVRISRQGVFRKKKKKQKKRCEKTRFSKTLGFLKTTNPQRVEMSQSQINKELGC